MSVQAGVSMARPGRIWIAGAVGAAAAVAVTTSVAQATGRFHWWAGFILVPGAMIAATGAVLLARRHPIGYLIGCVGALVFTVGALLMGGAMTHGWPLLISLPALAVAGTYAYRPEHPLARAFHRAIASLALVAVALGVTFLLLNGGTVDFGETDWWGWFMMAGAVIVVLNGLELLRHRIEYRLQAIALAVGPAVIVFLIGLRMARGDWPY
ncbi:hypothetical protein WEI85_01780 [Actinomycetes bacterium KLBMP 9797]